MKNVLFLFYTLSISIHSNAQNISSFTKYEREYVNELAEMNLRYDKLATRRANNHITNPEAWKDYFVGVAGNLVSHPFLKPDSHAKLFWRMYEIYNDDKWPNLSLDIFDADQQNMFIKLWVEEIKNKQLDGQTGNCIQLDHYMKIIYHTTADWGIAGPVDTLDIEVWKIYKTSAFDAIVDYKYTIAYLYDLLHNNEVLMMTERRHFRTHKMYKKEIGAYLISCCLASECEELYIPMQFDFYDEEISEKDKKIIDERVEKFREMLEIKYPYYLEAPPIKYSETMNWYKDKDGKPTKDASKIVEK